MNFSIVGRHFELTDAIKSYASNSIDSLKKYNLDIISVTVSISGDEKKGKKGFAVEFIINLPHKDTIVIKQKDKDVYAAIDLAIERAQKVLRRHNDKIKAHKATSVGDIASDELASQEERSNIEDEIIPAELDLYKPLEIEDALALLKESGQQFLVFADKEQNMRVIYKRAEANSYGLY
jgi:putative sigma-54 modulation protein